MLPEVPKDVATTNGLQHTLTAHSVCVHDDYQSSISHNQAGLILQTIVGVILPLFGLGCREIRHLGIRALPANSIYSLWRR